MDQILHEGQFYYLFMAYHMPNIELNYKKRYISDRDQKFKIGENQDKRKIIFDITKPQESLSEMIEAQNGNLHNLNYYINYDWKLKIKKYVIYSKNDEECRGINHSYDYFTFDNILPEQLSYLPACWYYGKTNPKDKPNWGNGGFIYHSLPYKSINNKSNLMKVDDYNFHIYANKLFEEKTRDFFKKITDDNKIRSQHDFDTYLEQHPEIKEKIDQFDKIYKDYKKFKDELLSLQKSREIYYYVIQQYPEDIQKKLYVSFHGWCYYYYLKNEKLSSSNQLDRAFDKQFKTNAQMVLPNINIDITNSNMKIGQMEKRTVHIHDQRLSPANQTFIGEYDGDTSFITINYDVEYDNKTVFTPVFVILHSIKNVPVEDRIGSDQAEAEILKPEDMDIYVYADQFEHYIPLNISEEKEGSDEDMGFGLYD